MTLHLEKKAIRVLGIAESFRKEQKYSTLAGVVMRSDLVIDGFAHSKLKVSGSDATSSTIDLYRRLHRNDINAIMISGSVLSLYNVLDIDEIYKELKIPVVALSFSKSRSNLAENIESRFPEKIAKEKINLLEKLGPSSRLRLETGYDVYVRNAGISDDLSRRLLNKFTLQGSLPEPVRVARLLAKSIATAKK
ncbi:MAG: endonuclease dU [Nitrososphaerales archaeon]